MTTCGCGDSSHFIELLEWPVYAVFHGLSPLYTTFLYFPHGENLLADTGVVPIGLALSPITWLWGPVTSFNVALTLGPVVSTVSMFVLLRRWVAWEPAAFVGGLLYGFSPFVIASLSKGWLNFTFLVIPPLVVACLDELLARQSRRPIPTGIHWDSLWRPNSSSGRKYCS